LNYYITKLLVYVCIMIVLDLN